MLAEHSLQSILLVAELSTGDLFVADVSIYRATFVVCMVTFS